MNQTLLENDYNWTEDVDPDVIKLIRYIENRVAGFDGSEDFELNRCKHAVVMI